VRGLKAAAKQRGIAFSADSEGGMFGFFFHPGPVSNLEQAKQSNVEQFTTFFRSMLRRGVYLAPSAFEAGFVSVAHTSADIERTLECADEAFHDVVAG
jgi:glutamate-1-semialdehyde 2,1-aminomutase